MTFALAMLGVSHAQAQEAPQVYTPAEVAARLKDQVGKWTYEGTSIYQGKTERVAGTMDCKLTAVAAALLCSITIGTPGVAGPVSEEVQLTGYDVESKLLRVSWVNNFGYARTATGSLKGDTLVVRLEGTQDGKPMVGIDETTGKIGAAERRQRGHVDVDGKRFDEWDFTYRRVK